MIPPIEIGPLEIFTFFVLGVMVCAGGIAFVVLGAMPGRIAVRRGHPQADAVRACGWIGVCTLGLLWPVAIVWAFWHPTSTNQAEGEALADSREGADSPATRVALQRMEQRLEALEQTRHEPFSN